MEQDVDARVIKTIRSIQLWIVAVVALLALCMLFGNALHVEGLRNLTPWGGPGKTNTAIVLLWMTVAFLLMTNEAPRVRSVAVILSFASLAVGVTTLIEWCSHWSAGIDNIIFPELVVGKDSSVLGRMPTNSAAAVILLAISVISGIAMNNKRLSQILSFGAFSIGLLSVAGHTFEVEGLLKIGRSTLISFPSAVAIMLLSGALFTAYPEKGFARVLSSSGRGGTLARCLLPISALFPALGFVTMLTGVPGSSDTGLVLVLVDCLALPVAFWAVATALEQVDEARTEALNASHKKSEFLANMSHEIRTPMNGVIGMTDMLLRTELNAEQKRYAMRIKESGTALLRVINEILDLSKVEAGTMTLERRVFDVSETVSGVVELLVPKAQAKNVCILTHIEPDIPLLCGDSGRVRQILMNLLGNAVKFSSQGRVDVTAAVTFRDSQTAVIKISVRDAGPGISKETLANLFQPFMQVNSTGSSESTGLGLSISKNLVDLMGGKIGVDSQPGKGSTFWFEISFPIAAVGEGPLLVTLPAPRPACNKRCGVLLVAEDHEVNRELALLLLAHLGFDAHFAENGALAVDMVKRFDYVAVLMDCQMPVLNGFDAARAIRKWEEQTGKHLPIIAMTAGAVEGSAQQCLASGMDDFIDKPIDADKFETVLNKWLPFSSTQLTTGDATDALLPMLNLNRLSRTLSSDATSRLFRIFAEDAAAEIEQIRKLWHSQSSDELLQVAHGLKGDCASIGAERLSSLCQQLESAVRVPDWDQAKVLIDAMDGAYHATTACFEAANSASV